ncbi:MAG: mechanosensitive ion channel domain-containing protein, partial [Verrucomicrobiota bacterium]
MNAPAIDNDFSDAVAVTCMRMIPGTLSLMLLFRLSLPTNLGPQHFRWSEETCKVVYDTVLWIMLPVYLIALAANFLYVYGIETEIITGSRVLYILCMALLIFAVHRVFHPKRGIFGETGIRFGFLRFGFTRWTIYIGLLVWLATLTLLLAFGYMVGVLAMIRSTVFSIWLLAGIAIIDGVLTRYIRIHRLKALLQHREKQLDEEADGEPQVEDERWKEIDPQIRQITNLLRIVIFVIGFALIWQDALPAFRTVGGTVLIGSAESPLLTLSQLSMLIVALVTTIVLAANLPSVIEIVVFRRIKSITPGNRHAFSTLVAYFIVLFGIIWASVIAEIEWAKVQWLIAAITVGLGFGMQEIFGNLVAGIILLFERPIRVGDIVTIDNTTGAISRIRIRGTTIQEFDKREVIVPNKTIITGKLINWTLTDTMTRLKIPVSVAYGSDTDKVTAVLLDILKTHSEVIDDPQPRVFFIEMADSSYNFICFAY